MPLPSALPPETLVARLDPSVLPFERTDAAPTYDRPVGQDRAIEAVGFFIGMTGPGYNIYCMGPEGTGKASLVRRFVREAAATQSRPFDWCYVNNFTEQHKPRALRLKAGTARTFAKDIENLLEDLRHALPTAFEGEEYRSRRKAIEDEYKQDQDDAFEEHRRRAEALGVAVVRTQVGLALAPLQDGEVMGVEDFQKLPEEEQARFKALMNEVQKGLESTLRELPKAEREKRERIKALDRSVAEAAIRALFAERGERYEDVPDVAPMLADFKEDVLDNLGLFLGDQTESEQQLPAFLRRGPSEEEKLARYAVNVLVSHDGDPGAPVVEESHPTQPNLVGRVEYRQHLGALTTDFSLIKAGALHRANGGYLVLEARKLLSNPFAWEDLKRALRTGEIHIEAPGASWGIWATHALDPQPIPLSVKVILLGEPQLYYLLCDYDPDFRELFKVAADFDTRMPRADDTIRDLALLLAEMARRKVGLPLDRGAVAHVIEHGSRLAADAAKLTTHMGTLIDLMREAEFHARAAGVEVVSAAHVRAAIDGRRRRTDRIPSVLREEVERDIIRIETSGTAVGQINGLAVIQIGPSAFGKPSRITARVRVGKGEVVNIEREAELSGPLHDKGVMILSAFLNARFGTERPLSLAASLVFEQSYGPVDGDSASSTELYALLSALAEAPIKQSLAVTGSVDQFGRVQAIGGVNEKIEGFFDLCAARGLTGDQGVLIPAANVTHLMLRDDVVEACRQGRFAIIPISTIDEGISLLTGIEAGDADEKGAYPSGSLNRRIAKRLDAFARAARRAITPEGKPGERGKAAHKPGP